MEFQAWAKTPRLFRDITISEKIDGTNACIIFESFDPKLHASEGIPYIDSDEGAFMIGAQSRNRLIIPVALSGDKSSDNYGFAAWVYENAEELFNLLGPGRHYGEWWGQGIARKYDMGVKMFSLFNTDKWSKICEARNFNPHQGYALGVDSSMIGGVPTLYRGPFDQAEIEDALIELQVTGSYVSPGFMKPEGICVYHHMSKQVYKVTLDNEDKGKWEVSE